MVIASSSIASRDRNAPPLPQSGQVARPRIDARLEASVRAHRVTVVAAPSGFGKTSAVGAWAVDRPGRVAWLTLRAFDDRPATVTPAIVRTLQTVLSSVAGSRGIPSIDPQAEDVNAAFEHVSEAISGLDEPLCLVIDDAHRAGSALADGVLGALVDAGPENLRLVIAGTGSIDGTLARWVLSHPSSAIRGEELAFDRDEVAALAGTARDDPWVERMLAATQGWPIAVRFLHLTGLEPEHAAADVLLRDYVHDHVIRQLPPHLRRFVLDTAVCDELTVELATAITGRTDASALLRRCIRLGLFLDRYNTPVGTAYRWHSLFAAACREILDDITPGRVAHVHAAAAAYHEADAPLTAVAHWLAADAPEAAVRVIIDRWVGILVRGDAAGLDRACTALPPPQSEAPGILLVRACAHDALGAPEMAKALRGEALARSEDAAADPAFEATLARAELFLRDDRAAVAQAADDVHAQLATTDAPAPRDRVALLYLLGWTGMRHRHDPGRTIELLETAAREASLVGDDDLRRRSQRTIAFVLAWAGRLRQAREVMAALQEMPDDDAPWASYVSGSTATVSGVIAYWADDLAQATREFERVIRGGRGAAEFGGVARMMLALTAAAEGGPKLIRRAGIELDRLPDQELQGVSWPVFRDAARAALAEAAGRVPLALQLAARYARAADLPLVTVVLVSMSDSGDVRTVSRDYAAGHVHLAYASTVHGIQGETTDASIVGPGVDAAGLYVGMTRGRVHNQVVAIARSDAAARARVADSMLRGIPEVGFDDSVRAARSELGRAARPAPTPTYGAREALAEWLREAWRKLLELDSDIAGRAADNHGWSEADSLSARLVSQRLELLARYGRAQRRYAGLAAEPPRPAGHEPSQSKLQARHASANELRGGLLTH